LSETKHEIAALLLACGAAGAWLNVRFLLIPYHICDVARWQRSTSGVWPLFWLRFPLKLPEKETGEPLPRQNLSVFAT